MKNRILLLGMFLLTIFSNCKKDTLDIFTSDDFEKGATLIESFLLVQVVNEFDIPLANAKITIGDQKTYNTDQNGTVLLSKVGIKTTGHLVSISKSGYFNSFKRVYPEAGVLKVMLVQKNNLDLPGQAGGNLNFGGVKLEFPANAIVDSKGQAFISNVNVSVMHIDPTANNFTQLAPGDLRAIRINGQSQVLASFGMIAVEMNDDSGNKLQIAPGKTVKIKMDLNGQLASTAPATMPTWSFDEVTGVWKEEGVATKSGNTYEFEASHFSFWNCDVPYDFIDFKAKLVSQGGQAISNLQVSLAALNGAGVGYAWSGTDGSVAGKVPANTEFNLEIASDCNGVKTIFKTQKIGPFSVDTDFGNIVVTLGSSNTEISGVVKDCGGNNLPDGVVKIEFLLKVEYASVTNGVFSKLLVCDPPGKVTLTAYDYPNLKTSLPQEFNIVNGQTNSIGVIEACIDFDEYVVINIDGNISYLTDNVYINDSLGTALGNYAINGQKFGAFGKYFSCEIGNQLNIATPFAYISIEGNFPGLLSTSFPCTNCLSYTSTSLNYTPGGYSEGTFSGTVPGTIIPISGSWRVKAN